MERVLARGLSASGGIELTQLEMEQVNGGYELDAALGGTWTQAEFCGNEYDKANWDD